MARPIHIGLKYRRNTYTFFHVHYSVRSYFLPSFMRREVGVFGQSNLPESSVTSIATVSNDDGKKKVIPAKRCAPTLRLCPPTPPPPAKSRTSGTTKVRVDQWQHPEMKAQEYNNSGNIAGKKKQKTSGIAQEPPRHTRLKLGRGGRSSSISRSSREEKFTNPSGSVPCLLLDLICFDRSIMIVALLGLSTTPLPPSFGAPP